MAEKTTLSDIAELAHVAPGTVYKALSGLKGVSEAKRKEIITLAQSLNYVVGAKASNEQKTIVALFPAPLGVDQYFYQYIWAGIIHREAELADAHFHIIKITFDGTQADQLAKLNKIYELYHHTMKALVTIIWEESPFLSTLKRFTDNGIQLFTVSADAPHSGRTTCIMADAYRTGKLAAEYLGSVVKGPAHVVIIGTKRDSANHGLVVRGFYDELDTINPQLQIIELYESKQYPEKLFETLEDLLGKLPDIKGIYANNARTTIKVVSLVHAHKKDRQLFVVGSELFKQSKEALETGSLDAIIDQGAYKQAYDAISMAFQVLVKDAKVPPLATIGDNLYLRNNAPSLPLDDAQSILHYLDKEFLKDQKIRRPNYTDATK
ncbi:MAG: LacI family DNA-binding transcriptional regulator [Sphaerochaetaceae bacterium]|nr:LacI family DNA-binding transcriptional regulator [Spirochaetales bacterium]MDY5498494.1 LacI family DNA-binding transcriptional regulator [Sphaerochaetaceae bacterium]